MSESIGAIQKARSMVVVLLEYIFYNWGRFVARRPIAVIIASLLFSGKYYETLKIFKVHVYFICVTCLNAYKLSRT